jgi:hypothetical protein
MRPAEIIALQRKQPFTGLRIYVSDGAVYDVLHPEKMTVSRSTVSIAVPPIDEEGVPERQIYCDPVHITRIEPLNGVKRAKRSARGQK